MISKRKIGKYSFQYVDYDVTIRAEWVDHDFGHEKTPRYEVRVYAERIDGGANERFRTSAEAPVNPSPSVIQRLVGKEPRRTNLADLVELGCERIRDDIDEMYKDIGLHRDEEEFAARVEAEAAVESWAEVE
jgi:hypothetical protein